MAKVKGTIPVLHLVGRAREQTIASESLAKSASKWRTSLAHTQTTQLVNNFDLALMWAIIGLYSGKLNFTHIMLPGSSSPHLVHIIFTRMASSGHAPYEMPMVWPVLARHPCLLYYLKWLILRQHILHLHQILPTMWIYHDIVVLK